MFQHSEMSLFYMLNPNVFVNASSICHLKVEKHGHTIKCYGSLPLEKDEFYERERIIKL